MPAQKEVKVKVATEEDLSGVEALEVTLDKLKKQRIQLGIDIASQKLNETQSKIEKLKQQKININTNAEKLKEVQSKIDAIDGVIKSSHNYNVNVSHTQLDKLKQELSQLEQEKIDLETNTDTTEIYEIDSKIRQLEQNALNLQIEVENGKLQQVESEIEKLDDTEIDVQVDNIAAMQAVDQISQGFDRLKNGASELKQNMDEVAQAGMQSEQNKAFLEMNLGADKAKQTYQDISDIVASMPGDDNTMRSVLSTAQALGNNLSVGEMKDATKTMADYMAGSATMGKQAVESQQDIMKYLLDGNTAELERGSIVSTHIDKLKDINTFQGRRVAMQQVLNELGYGGISTQDTMLNKQAEWEGMLYNSQDALSSMWLGAEKGAMDYILKLNDASDGLLGMGIVAAQMAGGPLIDTVSGLGQMAMGMKAIKDLGFVKWLKNLELANKLAKISQLELNLAFLTNPIFLVVAAIVALVAILAYLYFNNEQVRAAVDGLGQTFQWVGQIMYTSFINAINWIIQGLQNLWTYITTLGGLLPQGVNITGNQIIDSILAFLVFFATLPIQIGIILINTLAKALGFKGNFINTIWKAATGAVSKFAEAIVGIGQAIQDCLDWVHDLIMNHPIVKAIIWLGEQLSWAFSALGLKQHSPGDIYKAMDRELGWTSELLVSDNSLISDASRLGSDIVGAFGNPSLGVDTSFANSEFLNATVSDESKAGNGQTLIFNISDNVIDDDKRMDKIVDEITRRLAFNNETAGRTV